MQARRWTRVYGRLPDALMLPQHHTGKAVARRVGASAPYRQLLNMLTPSAGGLPCGHHIWLTVMAHSAVRAVRELIASRRERLTAALEQYHIAYDADNLIVAKGAHPCQHR